MLDSQGLTFRFLYRCVKFYQIELFNFIVIQINEFLCNQNYFVNYIQMNLICCKFNYLKITNYFFLSFINENCFYSIITTDLSFIFYLKLCCFLVMLTRIFNAFLKILYLYRKKKSYFSNLLNQQYLSYFHRFMSIDYFIYHF